MNIDYLKSFGKIWIAISFITLFFSIIITIVGLVAGEGFFTTNILIYIFALIGSSVSVGFLFTCFFHLVMFTMGKIIKR